MRRHLLSWSTVGLFIAVALAVPTVTGAQGTASLSGTVTDSATGRPIPAVQVLVTGTTRGALTDDAGRFVVRALSGGTYDVRAQRIGYRPATRQVTIAEGEATQLSFSLTEVARVLSEVVTVGYGTDTRANISSSVTHVDAQDIVNTPVAGIDAALTGKAAGVQVTQNAGNPGAGISVRIRGSSSISASNQPLYVVDGIPIIREQYSQLDAALGGQEITGVTGLNPDDVESITVLKDAAAAAIYGSRGSNGVVMVTTKRGQSGTPRINVSAYTGIQDVAHKVELLNAKEYVEYMSEAFTNDGYSQQDILDFFGTATIPDGSTSTDWQSEIFRKAPVTDVTLGVNGGNDRMQYFVSGSVFDQMGIAYGSGYKRQSGRVNLDFQATEKLAFKSSINLSREDHARIEGDNTIDGEVTNALAEQPWLPARNPDGFFSSPDDGLAYSNPLAIGKLDDAHSRSLRALSSLEAAFNFTPQLRLTGRAGADVMNLSETRWESPKVVGRYSAGVSGVSRQGSVVANRYVLETFLNYDLPASALHTLNTTVGSSLEWDNSEDSFLRGESFGNDQFRYVGNAAKITAYDGGATDARLASFFGRANYSLLERYLFTAGIRLDGSSRFGLNNRYGSFPSASVGWIASKEPWLAPVANFVDLLKLRVSVGYTGNQAISSNFAPLAKFGKANYGDEGGLAPSTLGDPNLRWESTREFDAGFDLTTLSGRVTLIGDTYVKKTSNLLVLRPIPGSSGFTSVWSNVGSMQNKGVEAQLTTRNVVSDGDGFTWTSDFNIAHNANKVLELYNNQPFSSGFRNVNRVQVGAPLGAFYTYKVKEVDPATGDLVLEDLTGDGVITSEDRTIVGSPYPKYTGGFGNEFTWKGFNLHSFLQFSQGAEVYNAIGIFADDAGYNLDNKYKRVMTRWQQPGDITDQPRASWDGSSNAYYATSRLIEDASYLRIQEVTLGYTIPRRWASSLGMQNTRLFISGRNLHNFTDYIGYNPDVNSFGSSANFSLGTDFYAYPIARSYTFGITGNW